MRKKLLGVLFIFISTLLFSAEDSFLVSFQIKRGYYFNKAELKSYSPFSVALPSVKLLDREGVLKIPKSIDEGFYILTLASAEFERDPINLDIYLNPNSSSFNLVWDIEGNQLNFTNSPENQAWHEYIQKHASIVAKIQNLRTQRELNSKKEQRLRKLQYNYRDAFVKKYQNHFLGIYLSNLTKEKTPSISQFWAGFDLSDTRLMNSMLYSKLIYEYSTLYNKAFPLSSNLEKFADDLIQKFSVTQKTYDYILHILTSLIQQREQEDVLMNFDLKYNSNESVLTGNHKTELNERLDMYKHFQKGKKVPELMFEFQGEKHSLQDIQSDTMILAFYSSTCDFCQAELPKLDIWRFYHPRYQILGIGMDINPMAHVEFANKFPNIIHFSDYKGLESQISKDYHINKLPVFFVLGKKRELLFKSNSIKGIVEFLK